MISKEIIVDRHRMTYFDEFFEDNKGSLENLTSSCIQIYDTSKVEASVLIIVREDDEVMRKDENIKIHKLLPDSRLMILESGPPNALQASRRHKLTGEL
ncbi:MAG: hypothetical protein DRN49_04505 [Thaumarchaeota archaeon]|nr:MAG: hypothetical protein DRN49_04505 [Nitrososphaerota archaeon]